MKNYNKTFWNAGLGLLIIILFNHCSLFQSPTIVEPDLSLLPTAAAPTTIALNTPLSDTTGPDQFLAKEFVFAGTPGTSYRVTLTGLSDDLSLSVQDSDPVTGEMAMGNSLCFSNQVGTNSESCTGVPLGSNLYIHVSGAVNAAFTIVVTLGANEGSTTAPVILTLDTPYDGQVDYGNSYYSLSGLASGYYTVTLTATAGDLSGIYLYTYPDDTFTSWDNCALINSDNPKTCNITITSGSLGVKVDAGYGSALYTIQVSAVPFVNEGSVASPMPVTLAVNKVGTVLANSNSYYSISGLSATSTYTVAISDLFSNADIYVYSDAAFTTQVCSSTWTSSTYNDVCHVTGLTKAYVRVQGGLTNSAYVVITEAVSTINEGTLTSSEWLSSDTLYYTKTVGAGGTSYYYVWPYIWGNSMYIFGISSMSSDVDLYVYSSTGGTLLCSSVTAGLTDESCWVDVSTWTPSSYYFYIEVVNKSSSIGSAYQLISGAL